MDTRNKIEHENTPLLKPLLEGITFKFEGYDHDGIPQWLLSDVKGNKFFIIGWPEYEMLSRWHLGHSENIIEAVNRETTLTIDQNQLDELYRFLNKHCLVKQSWTDLYKNAKENKLIKQDNLFYWFIRYYLFFRIPLFHPDKFLDRTRHIGQFLFHRYTLYAMMCLGILAIYQITKQWSEFSHTFSSIFSWQGLVFYLSAFTFTKFFHEFGHAYMCKHYGVPVPTMGVAFLVFWPVLYTDTTQSWSLSSHQRLRISLAGMWVETYITIIAALIWANVHNITIQMICYVTIAINWISTLLINASPFMRFDGYYILSDALKVPNLQSRSFALARWQIRHWLFGWEASLPESFSKKMHWILVVYALITWIYRLVIYFGIALLVYHFFFKLMGILLFTIELFAFILRPIFQELSTWYQLRHQFTFNKNTIFTLTGGALTLLLLLLPLNNTIKMNATLSYSTEFLHAPQDAILKTELPLTGNAVQKDQVVIQLLSPALEQSLIKNQLECQKILVEIRRASFDTKQENKIGNLRAELMTKKTEQDRLIELKEELTIRAPYDGIVNEVASNLKPNDPVMKNTWLVSIINSKKQIVEAYIEQPDLNRLSLHSTGFFYPSDLDKSPISVKVVAIEAINTSYLAGAYPVPSNEHTQQGRPVDTPIYHANMLGGRIAAEVSEKGEYIPVHSIYRVLLMPEKTIELSHIEMGTAVLSSEENRSFLFRAIYKFKSILTQESSL